MGVLSLQVCVAAFAQEEQREQGPGSKSTVFLRPAKPGLGREAQEWRPQHPDKRTARETPSL